VLGPLIEGASVRFLADEGDRERPKLQGNPAETLGAAGEVSFRKSPEPRVVRYTAFVRP
jgi:hypothetical protein